MGEFLKEDYYGMQINVNEADMETDFLLQYPDLRLNPEFAVNLDIRVSSAEPDAPPKIIKIDRNKIIKYVALAYDKHSPFVKKYKEPNVRKYHAMVEAGYTIVGKKFERHIEDIVSNSNTKVADMVVCYLKMHNNLQYAHLIMMENLYYNKQKEIYLNQQSSSLRVKELEDIKTNYENAQRELLAQDTDAKLLKSLYHSIIKDKLGLAPEDIAKSLKEKGVEATLSTLND
jgi:hypothetical protein